jgi:hypothetical protein
VIIKLGILLDCAEVPGWQRDIINYIKNHSSLSLELIVLNNTKNNSYNYTRTAYKVLRKLDRTLFKVKEDNFRVYNISDLIGGIDILRSKPIKSKFTDEISKSDIEIIKRKNIDILIRFGFRVLKGNILNASRYGVLSLHHGDNTVNRGGPPAFWEVVNREAVTGVTLQVLTDDLDGGKVLGKAFVKTDFTSFNRNQNAVYSAGVELLCSKLNNISKLSADTFFSNLRREHSSSFYSNSLYRDPGNFKSMKIAFAFLVSRIRIWLDGLWFEQQWCLYYRNKDKHFETSIFRYKRLTPPKGIDWADPFILSYDNKNYVFFEELVKKKNKAHISCFVFDENGKLLSDKALSVLEEPFHLSYPCVVEFNDSYYMIPERGASKSVWLYRSEKFPTQWKAMREILSLELYDPTLLEHNGHWYLFGTQKPLPGNSPHQYLYIYYTDNILTGEWTSHPSNPVTRDVRGARPAGKIFVYDGKLIRPAQIGAPKYGYGIRFHEITKLTPTEFEESMVEDILPLWRDDLLATHTFNSVGGFSMLDAQIKRRRFF